MAELPGGLRPKILVVANSDRLSDCVADYSIDLAERLNYGIIALLVRGNADRPLHDHRKGIGGPAVGVENLCSSAAARGILCRREVASEELGSAIERTFRAHKRIELVITGSEEDKDEIGFHVPVPVYSITPVRSTRRAGGLRDDPKGGTGMVEESRSSRNSLIARTVALGLGSVGLYGVLFAGADSLMPYFTKGGWYAAFPITTAFIFSAVHGSFASHLWSALGIEARKSGFQQKRESQVVRKRPAKRPRAYAYINPWHRL
ncbi:MAG: hypothetical protein AB1714_14300 [Acidobacteriota bacterium]